MEMVRVVDVDPAIYIFNDSLRKQLAVGDRNPKFSAGRCVVATFSG